MSKTFTGKWGASPANINTDAPFDVRLVVSNLSDLLSASTYNKGLELYPGIVVAVIETGKESLWTLPNEATLASIRQIFANASYEPAEATEENVKALGWKKIGDDLKEQVLENTTKLTPINYDPDSNEWKNYVINNESLGLQSGLTINRGQIYTNTQTFSVNNILGNSTTTIFSVSNDGKISGNSVLWADESTPDITDTYIVTKGYLNKKLEEFTPKIQSQLQMYVYDIDENDNIESDPSDDVANIQIVRETNGILTFEVENATSSEHLAGSSQAKVLDYLQFTITDKDSNGILHPSDDVATVKVVRNATSRKLSIRIS